MKKLISLLLVSAMLVSFTACAGGSTSDVPPDTTIETGQNANELTEETDRVIETGQDADGLTAEIDRAISYGLVPEGLQGDYDASVTFRQYSQMLTNLIRIWDESRLGEWEEIIALAAESDEEMQREDGILATAYAMVLMGQNAPGTDSLHLDIDQIMEQLPGEIDTPSWDYPLFPSWEEIGFEWCNSNYMWGGVSTCAILISRVSGQAIYPYDFEGKSAHLQDPLTREEAICAVLRLGETDPAILEPEGTYVQLSDVGS